MIHDLAIACINLGWHVFPLYGKKPCTPNGFLDAVNTETGWKALVERYPDMTGYGVATGPSGLVVLDIDIGVAKNGEASFAKIEEEHVVPPTLVVHTGGGGRHYYFQAKPTRPVRSPNGVMDSVDIKSNGGYVVGPGSIHPVTGQSYTMQDNQGLALAPDWLLDLAESRKKPGEKAPALFGVAPDKPTIGEFRAAIHRWKKLSRREAGAGTAWAAMRAILRGDPYAVPGIIYDTNVHLAYWLSADFPNLDPSWFQSEYLVPCWLKMAWPLAAEYDESISAGDWERSWTTGVSKHAEEAQSFAGAKQTRLDNAISDAFGGYRSEPYTDDEIVAFAKLCDVSADHFVKRWVVQAGTAYYIWFMDGYRGPFRQSEVLTACAKYLAPAEGRVRLMTMGPTGEFQRRNLDQILSDYATHAECTAYDLSAEHAYYDGAVHTLVEAPCPLRSDELGGALESPEVHAWLDGLCGGGETLDRVLDWMSVAGRLELAAPAVWFLGGARKGKSLFARGMAQLWDGRGRACTLGDAMGRFNSDILRCPLVEGEESIPRDSRGRPQVDELKRFISAENHRIERKGLDLHETRGGCRVVISANNENMLALQADLTKDDIQALGERLIMVEVPTTCPNLHKDVAQEWLRTSAIARHALWLAENRELALTADRFACAATPEGVKSKLLAHSGLHSAVMEHVALEIVSSGGEGGPMLGGKSEPAVRVLGDGRILICPTLLRGEVPRHGVFTRDKISSKALRDACKAVTEAGTAKPKPIYSKNPRMVYRVLDVNTFMTWLTESDFDITGIISGLEQKQSEASSKDTRRSGAVN